MRITHGGGSASKMVKSGGSYLSQCELPVTFGLGRYDAADKVIVHWPSCRVEEHSKVKAGSYECTEGKGIRPA